MSSKIINIVVVCVLSFFVADRANAGLIIGNHYSDNAGIQWEYVGYFDLADGPDFFVVDNITPYNAIEAAELKFGMLLAGGDYAVSSNDEAAYPDIANFIVNHMAWYDSYGDRIVIHGESVLANIQGDSSYDAIGDISAFIGDRAMVGENINHVFKSIAVPEPSTIVIFSLAFMGLIVRRIKTNNPV
ncbi:PEP-CTERM sorting domain-containing protein [Colwellia sp. BRX10-4]|uniref:PEP-CTERM sorting domain-containing protein n=1 Tax=Colwellia sp. BRX10-4 TaxID=2759843 RepID=UPI0015F4E22E|nr:PEP-CTERM sorting domain-containing protein [Colwellia sp. BRX10-4]MBA6399905.1 PEP-CTERM sorting domain-containing protein [Colwellia sp. BRX10-4]